MDTTEHRAGDRLTCAACGVRYPCLAAHERVRDAMMRRVWKPVLDASAKLQAEVAVPESYAQWLLDEVARRLDVESRRL